MSSNNMDQQEELPAHSPAEGIIEQRILRIEERLDRMEARSIGTGLPHPAWAFALGLSGLGFGYFGLGLPQHYYQPLFAGLLLVLLYHRGLLIGSRGAWHWPQIAVNFLVISLLFKLLIGGGVASPFEWLKVPVIAKSAPTGDSSWYTKIVPEFSVQWKGIPKVTDWSVDLTKIQTLLLIATLAGGLFRFQPFTSLTALALLLISIPTYLNFNWDWVIMFLILGSISVYIQSRISVPRRE